MSCRASCAFRTLYACASSLPLFRVLQDKFVRYVRMAGLLAYELEEERNLELPASEAWSLVRTRELAAKKLQVFACFVVSVVCMMLPPLRLQRSVVAPSVFYASCTYHSTYAFGGGLPCYPLCRLPLGIGNRWAPVPWRSSRLFCWVFATCAYPSPLEADVLCVACFARLVRATRRASAVPVQERRDVFCILQKLPLQTKGEEAEQGPKEAAESGAARAGVSAASDGGSSDEHMRVVLSLPFARHVRMVLLRLWNLPWPILRVLRVLRGIFDLILALLWRTAPRFRALQTPVRAKEEPPDSPERHADPEGGRDTETAPEGKMGDGDIAEIERQTAKRGARVRGQIVTSPRLGKQVWKANGQTPTNPGGGRVRNPLCGSPLGKFQRRQAVFHSRCRIGGAAIRGKITDFLPVQ